MCLSYLTPSPEAVELGGMYLTDHLGSTSFRIADGISIPAGGFLLFWADNSPDQGIYHTNFALSKSGESIGPLDTDANGNAPLDTYSFGPQAPDVWDAARMGGRHGFSTHRRRWAPRMNHAAHLRLSRLRSRYRPFLGQERR